jgi:hypothetical protein
LAFEHISCTDFEHIEHFNNFLAKVTVQLEMEISLRQAVSDASICDGQGFTKSPRNTPDFVPSL